MNTLTQQDRSLQIKRDLYWAGFYAYMNDEPKPSDPTMLKGWRAANWAQAEAETIEYLAKRGGCHA